MRRLAHHARLTCLDVLKKGKKTCETQRAPSSSSCRRLSFFLHLFKLDQALLATEDLPGVLKLEREMFFKAESAANNTHEQSQVVDFVVADEAVVAAKPEDRGALCELVLGLRIKRKQV